LQGDKAKICNVKVIPNEECVPKHKLLVMGMHFHTTKSWHKTFKPRVCVWKLKEEEICEQYNGMVRYKVEEAEWKYHDVNEHWQQVKNIMMETAQDICGLSKGQYRHNETWAWNDEVAEAVREKKIKYGNWKRVNSTPAWKEYKKSRENAKRVIFRDVNG